MKYPIDRFKGKTSKEIYEKESLLDHDNLEKNDQLAMFIAAFKVFLPGFLIIAAPFLIFAWLI